MRSATPANPTAVWSAAGEGDQLWFLGTLAIVRVPGEAVEGRFSITEFLFRRHTSPALHTHPQEESYIVLDGSITVKAGTDRFELGPGGTAAIPAGVPHTFRVDSKTARVLVLSTPGWDRGVRASCVGACASGGTPATGRSA